MVLSDKQKGMGLALIGILFITPDSLLVRLITLDSWDLIFFRGLLPFFFLLIKVLVANLLYKVIHTRLGFE